MSVKDLNGIQYLIDETGEKTAVVIDLKRHGGLWEDVYDQLIARQRQHEPRESLDEVKAHLRREEVFPTS